MCVAQNIGTQVYSSAAAACRDIKCFNRCAENRLSAGQEEGGRSPRDKALGINLNQVGWKKKMKFLPLGKFWGLPSTDNENSHNLFDAAAVEGERGTQ